MEKTQPSAHKLDARIAQRLKMLRIQRGLSLDALASLSQVSRATLSRLENAEVSATAQVLNRLCAAYGITLSRLMFMVEDNFPARLLREEQPVWEDNETGFLRRSVSPPSHGLAGEVVECSLKPAAVIAYDLPPRPGLEHHLVMTEGELEIIVDGETHHLRAGDCLRYQLHGPSRFATPFGSGARYFIFLI